VAASEGVGGRLYFSAWTPASGREFWASDGTAAGTALLRDLRPGASVAFAWSYYAVYHAWNPPGFVRSGESIFFAADDGTGTELWAMPIEIFYDGFEGGSRARWSSTSP
jgi:ELWxxDGT repeat protein